MRKYMQHSQFCCINECIHGHLTVCDPVTHVSRSEGSFI